MPLFVIADQVHSSPACLGDECFRATYMCLIAQHADVHGLGQHCHISCEDIAFCDCKCESSCAFPHYKTGHVRLCISLTAKLPPSASISHALALFLVSLLVRQLTRACIINCPGAWLKKGRTKTPPSGCITGCASAGAVKLWRLSS